MLSQNNKISIRQLQILLILDIFGTGVTVLPRVVAELAGQDGWICVIAATALIMAAAWFITSLAGMFPSKTFFEYISEILSKPIGVVVSAAFVFRIAVGCGLQLRIFGEIVRRTLLPATPLAVVGGIMLLLGAYAAAKGYETRARMAEVLILIVILPLAFVFVSASGDIDFTNLLPVLAASPEGLARGGVAACFAFSGIELCLLVFPYLNRANAARVGILRAALAIGALMAIITCVTIARFGPFEIKNQMWPVLEMMDAASLPGSFIERQESLIMSFWIVSAFAVISAGLFFSSQLSRDIIKATSINLEKGARGVPNEGIFGAHGRTHSARFNVFRGFLKKGKRSSYMLVLAPVIFGVSFYPKNLAETYEYMTLLNHTFGSFYMFVLPPVALAAAKIRGLGK